MDVIGVKRTIIGAVKDHLMQSTPTARRIDVRSTLDIKYLERGDDGVVQNNNAAALAARQTGRMAEFTRQLKHLECFHITDSTGQINEGSLLQLEANGEETCWYFILPCCTGEDFHIAQLGAPVTIVSTSAPIIESATSTPTGQEFTVGKTTYRVVGIF